MSMKPAFNVVVPRNYQKNGEEKTAWDNVGTLFVDKETGKMSLKINSLPVHLFTGENAGWCNVFKIMPKENAIEGAKQVEGDDLDEPIDLSEIPF